MKSLTKTITLLTLILASITTLTVAEDWPQWRGPNRDGTSSETNLLKKWPDDGPKLLWHFDELGDGYASPSTYKGKIYVPGTINKQGYLHAFDTTGKHLWKQPYGSEWTKSFPGSRSTPALDNDKAYLISGLGVAYCLNADNGSIIWSQDICQKFKGKSGRWGYGVAPLLCDDKVIFSPGGPQTEIVALDKDTGELIWKTQSTSESDAYCPPLAFTHADKKFIVTLMENSVWFINAQDGKLIYRDLFSEYQDQPKDINPVMPIYHDGCVFTTSGYDSGSAMYQLSPDAKTITRKWTQDALDTHHGGVVLLDGYIYGSNWKGNRDGDWLCLDWKTGKIMYQTHWQNKGSIIAADNMLYCYEEKDGNLALVHATPEKFDLISSFPITRGGEQHWAHPVISNKVLYIRHGNALMAYDIAAQ